VGVRVGVAAGEPRQVADQVGLGERGRQVERVAESGSLTISDGLGGGTATVQLAASGADANITALTLTDVSGLDLNGQAAIMTAAEGGSLTISDSVGGGTATVQLAAGGLDADLTTLNLAGVTALDLNGQAAIMTTGQGASLTISDSAIGGTATVQLDASGTDANITALQFSGVTALDLNGQVATLTATQSGSLMLNDYAGGGRATIQFDGTETNQHISGFFAPNDKIDLNAVTAASAITNVSGSLTNADAVYFLTGQAAGAADSTAAAATAISGGATWTSAANASYVVIVDDNSSGIFKWVEGGTDGAQQVELTLVGTVDAQLLSGSILLA